MLEQRVNEAHARGWYAYIHESAGRRWLWACEVPFESVSFAAHVTMTGDNGNWALTGPRGSVSLWNAEVPTLDAARQILGIAFPA